MNNKGSFSLSKKGMVFLIGGILAAALLIWILLLVVILGGSDSDKPSKKSGKKSDTKKTVVVDPEVEEENQKKDKKIAEEIRHTVEVASAEIEVYDEAMIAIGNSDSEVAILSVGEGGLKWHKDVPNLASDLKDVYSDRLNKITWSSEKYKGQRFTVYYERSPQSDIVLFVRGKWDEEVEDDD